MKHILQIVIALSCFLSISQSVYNSDTYRVTLTDIKSTTFEKDSTTNAFVIYEEGDSYVNRGDYDLESEIRRKIKILNKEGFSNGNVEIYLYNNDSDYEKVEDIIAATYNFVDGEVVKTELQEKDIYKEKYDDNHTIVKFTLPNLQPGSVISYSYKLSSPFMFKYKGWDFQGDIPKLYSEYRTSIPGYWLYNIKLVGGKKLVVNTSEIEKKCLELYGGGGSADCSVSVYAMKDIPAFIEEDYMTTKSNYLARVEYELKTFRSPDGRVDNYTQEWEDVDKEFRTTKEVGRQLRKNIDAEELLGIELFQKENNLDKLKSIYEFVQWNYTWNGDYKIFTDVSIRDLLQEKTGNVSSINILLHNLLNESGIEAKPVLLSTRDNGFPTTIYPVITDFNYLIVQVELGGKTYLLDATDKALSFGQIPFRCLNQPGRLMDFENGSKWIDITPKKSNIFYIAELSIDDNGDINGEVKSRRTGYHALNRRKAYFSNKDAYLTDLENVYESTTISNLNVTTAKPNELNFEESFNMTYSDDIVGDIIYLDPFFHKFFTQNPFKLQERSYPIDFGYKDSYIYSLTLNLNEDYEVLETPKDLVMEMPNNTGKLLFSTKINGGLISLNFRLTFNETIYPAEYYEFLKEFMNNVVNIQTNSLILLKKK